MIIGEILALDRNSSPMVLYYTTVPIRGHAISYLFVNWRIASLKWRIATLNWWKPLWTGDRHFKLAIRHFELGIATLNWRLSCPKGLPARYAIMASIIFMLVSLSAICCCLSSCKAVLHSYIPVVQQNIGKRDGLISTYFHLGFSHVEILPFLTLSHGIRLSLY